jgi:glycosyltransferase involved in cell wall biosynthesis
MPEVVDEGVTGHLVDDVASAVDVIDRAAAMDRRQVRATAERRFGVARMVDDYLDVYEEVLARG